MRAYDVFRTRKGFGFGAKFHFSVAKDGCRRLRGGRNDARALRRIFSMLRAASGHYEYRAGLCVSGCGRLFPVGVSVERAARRPYWCCGADTGWRAGERAAIGFADIRDRFRVARRSLDPAADQSRLGRRPAFHGSLASRPGMTDLSSPGAFLRQLRRL